MLNLRQNRTTSSTTSSTTSHSNINPKYFENLQSNMSDNYFYTGNKNIPNIYPYAGPSQPPVTEDEFWKKVPQYPNDGVLLIDVQKYNQRNVLALIDDLAAANGRGEYAVGTYLRYVCTVRNVGNAVIHMIRTSLTWQSTPIPTTALYSTTAYTILYCTTLHYTVQCGVVQYFTTLYHVTPHYQILHSAILNYATLYCTTVYNTLPSNLTSTDVVSPALTFPPSPSPVWNVGLGTQQFTVLALHDRWVNLTPRANLRHFPDIARGYLMWFFYNGFIHFAGTCVCVCVGGGEGEGCV
jgi:hypothetical protein